MVLETQALRAADPLIPIDDLPQFKLYDAVVEERRPRRSLTSIHGNAQKLVNLLDVHLDGPYVVRGRLGPLDEDSKELAILPNVANIEITIPEVNIYSLELLDSGDITIWAQGKAGWYALTPATQYRGFFKSMEEKARIWLFLEDKYVHAPKSRGRKSRDTVENLYKEFASMNPRWSDPKVAAALFHKHAPWLLLRVLAGDASSQQLEGTALFLELTTIYKVNPPSHSFLPTKPTNLANSC